LFIKKILLCFSIAIASLLSFNSNADAIALKFDATYELKGESRPINETFAKYESFGSIQKAPLDLNQISWIGYVRFDSPTYAVHSSLPANLGYPNFPKGSITLSNDKGDSIFGDDFGDGILNLSKSVVNGKASFNVTGGSGQFIGTTGSLNYTFTDNLIFESDRIVIPKVVMNFTGKLNTPNNKASIPEPSILLGFLSIGNFMIISGARKSKTS
jgi:hypothetical protein